MDVELEHRTTYTFDRPVRLGPHLIRLRPAPHARTPIHRYALTVGPGTNTVHWQQDAFGNHQARVVFSEPTEQLIVDVDLVADLTTSNPFDFLLDPEAATFPFAYEPQLAADLVPYTTPVDEVPGSGQGPGPRLRAWLADLPLVPPAGVDTVTFLLDLTRRMAADITYTVRYDPGVLTPDATLAAGIASCRDTAWLLVSALRSLGFAARFVSGYLVQLIGDDVEDESIRGTDLTDLHAWAEVFVPGAGWIGLDATSGMVAGEGHIPLSATPHPDRAAPITGTAEPSVTTMTFHNRVIRLAAATNAIDGAGPADLDDGTWARIDATGRAVDAALAAADVRLTMGGEPTFVSATDTQDPMWRIAADGEEKRLKGAQLADRLRRRYVPDGIAHHALGKWYPGEPAPRWQVTITWRRDGEPLWPYPELLDDPRRPADPIDPADSAGTVAALTAGIAAGLGIDGERCQPAYEDALSLVADEVRLPVGEPPADDVAPWDLALAARRERAELVSRLDATDEHPVGWVIPVHPVVPEGDVPGDDAVPVRWGTSPWRFRRGHLALTPGYLPMGFRLPLDQIAWTSPPFVPDPPALAPRPPLPVVDAPGGDVPEPAVVVPPDEAPTSALCVQERDGHYGVFLPPLTRLDDAVVLVGVVAEAAKQVGVPVVLEGYGLPGDPRTISLSVAPDPGVLEINLHPTSSWPELVEVIEALYDDGHAIDLSAQTYQKDGTVTSSGGGSHITIGGPTTADSPLLRRPDVLVSMLTFWQHHPSLSYAFSGRFVGPTSQAPRVDEARHESLYELEIAFAQIDAAVAEGDPPPGLVDRALRNLLVDLTGNTHRAEFCIDKLFSPDSERGKLGLLELRSFEMQASARTELLQHLLVRALLARFWAEPYRGNLVRWGNALHDRWALPVHLADDLAAVAADLSRHRFAFDPSWFTPSLDLRFPTHGTVELGDIRLRLRAAIEPWPVMGEETSGGGTARYVDSSVERVQVSLDGASGDRYLITCNGVGVPLGPTARSGLVAAGVRYKASAPPSSLHPTIGIHSPLTFEVIDTWTSEVLGSATHHVVDPDPDVDPVEDYPSDPAEATARRVVRFEASTERRPVDVGAVDRPVVDPDFPLTLDLRRRPPSR